MIPLLNTQIIIRDHDIITAYYCANNCSGGKLNLIDSATNDPRSAFISVRYSFNGLRDTAAQRGNADNISAEMVACCGDIAMSITLP